MHVETVRLSVVILLQYYGVVQRGAANKDDLKALMAQRMRRLVGL